jgi:hypothetical protein
MSHVRIGHMLPQENQTADCTGYADKSPTARMDEHNVPPDQAEFPHFVLEKKTGRE